MEKAGGQGYAKLYAYDTKRKACLLERLGKPIDQLGLSVKGQLEILCAALEKTWALPTGGAGLLPGEESIAWFREYLAERWESLGHPCPREVLGRAFSYLRAREAALGMEWGAVFRPRRYTSASSSLSWGSSVSMAAA